MPPSPREKLRSIVEDAHEAVVRGAEHPGEGGPGTGSPGDTARPDIAGPLAAAGFTARASAGHFTALCDILFGAGADDDDALDLFEACLAAASPDAALLNLHRYLDSAGGVPVFVSTVVKAPPLREMLVTVFGASQYLSDIIVRDPSTVYWLIEGGTWSAPETVEGYEAWFGREADMFHSREARLDAVRRAHRRALLRIGVRDLVHREPVEDITARLSNLADAVARVVLRVICEELEIDTTADRGLAVIAMGKLGGVELNYSSDIDLIYTCEDADDDTLALYTRAARRLTDALSELTPEGYLYRVDLRLRPDGQSGPLVSSESALRVYYENRGRPWEFQAMLKARVIAGNTGLGARLLRAIAAMTFDPTLSYSPLEDIARMRVQIKENIPARERGANIKLMAGGIRDVEFIAQALQLMHGYHHRELRTPGTLTALARIRDLDLLEGWQVDNLEEAYRFFRVVEHRLQMMHQLKTHTVPESKDEIALLARRVSHGPVGEYDTDGFLDTLSRHLNNVRTFSESFFAGEDVHPHSVLLMLPEGDERAEAIIGQYGIRDVRRAMRTLNAMAYGSFPRLLDRGARAAFEELLPHLLEDIAVTGDPDRTLVHASQIAAAARSETSFYRRLVQSPSARDTMVGIAGYSSVMTRKLCTQIGAFEMLVRPSEELEEAMRPAEVPARDSFDAAVAAEGGERARERRERQRAWLDRVQMSQFVYGFRRDFRSPAEAEARTHTARIQLAAALDDAVGGEPVALFVLGSYAVGEPRLHSDADVIVVSDGADIPAVIERVQTVTRWFGDGGLLKLDFRLRGEGASSPLVQDLEYYESYLRRRMSLWERIALSKCRAWWGDAGVQQRFMAAVRHTVARPFTRDGVGRLATMRARVESLAPTRLPVWETKRSAGGRYDIEYLTAIGLARHCGGDEDFFTLDTRERIERVTDHGVLTPAQADDCLDALDLFSLVDHLMELQGLGHPTSDEKADYLETYLARALSALGRDTNPGGVAATIERARQAVRAAYIAALDRLV